MMRICLHPRWSPTLIHAYFSKAPSLLLTHVTVKTLGWAWIGSRTLVSRDWSSACHAARSNRWPKYILFLWSIIRPQVDPPSTSRALPDTELHAQPFFQFSSTTRLDNFCHGFRFARFSHVRTRVTHNMSSGIASGGTSGGQPYLTKRCLLLIAKWTAVVMHGAMSTMSCINWSHMLHITEIDACSKCRNTYIPFNFLFIQIYSFKFIRILWT